MDKNLGSPIAYGRTAEIYAWDEGHILKLFHDWFGREEYGRWLPIVAAARLSENIPELEQWLLAQAEKLNQPPAGFAQEVGLR